MHRRLPTAPSEHNAIHAVAGAGRRIPLAQAMHVGTEAGEALLEVPGETQVIQHRRIALAEAFAWHDQRNAWRIRHQHGGGDAPLQLVDGQDRKSTRLNSSHVKSSYAVFCLKKKTSNA